MSTSLKRNAAKNTHNDRYRPDLICDSIHSHYVTLSTIVSGELSNFICLFLLRRKKETRTPLGRHYHRLCFSPTRFVRTRRKLPNGSIVFQFSRWLNAYERERITADVTPRSPVKKWSESALINFSPTRLVQVSHRWHWINRLSYVITASRFISMNVGKDIWRELLWFVEWMTEDTQMKLKVRRFSLALPLVFSFLSAAKRKHPSVAIKCLSR